MELLLISGLLCDASLFAEQIKALSNTVQITVADHKSHDSMQTLAENILAKAPPKFALAGFSMGGYIALEMMRQAPERVLKLALLDTSPYADSPEQTATRQQKIAEARQTGKASIASILPSLIPPERHKDKALMDAVFAMDKNNTLKSYINQQSAIINRADSSDVLPQITCPTLVLCGRQDAITPVSIHQDMADTIPHATLVVIEDCGHASTMERPAEVNAAMLEWLES